jgi:hypothetical protein
MVDTLQETSSETVDMQPGRKRDENNGVTHAQMYAMAIPALKSTPKSASRNPPFLELTPSEAPDGENKFHSY